MMKKLLSVILAAMLVLTCFNGVVFAEYGTFTYDLAEDTFVSYSQSTVNYGGSQELFLNNKGRDKAQDRFGIIKIDLSEFEGSDIEEATLNFYVFEGKDAKTIVEGDLSLYAIEDNDWSQNEITYSTFTQAQGELAGSVSVNATKAWYSIDITGFVNNDTDKIMSFIVRSEADVRMKISSSEATSNKPYVSVTGDKQDIPVSGVELDSTEAEMTTKDEPLTLTANVKPANAANKEVKWSSSDESVATVSDGVVTPVGEGDTIITVTTVDGEFTAECRVTVSDIHVTEISLNKDSLKLYNKGRAELLTATVLPDVATNKTVLWSSSDESVVTVSETGVVTPVGEGQAVITATTEDGGFTAECFVVVERIGGEGAEEYKITPTDDTYYSSSEPGPNGALDTIYIRNSMSNTAEIRKGYMRFDLSEYADYEIASARLCFLQSTATYNGNVEMSVKGFDDNGWSEEHASYSEPVTPSSLTNIETVEITTPGTWYYVDVKDFVTADKDGVFSIELSLEGVTNYFKIYSKDSSESSVPYIELIARPYAIDSTDSKNVNVKTGASNRSDALSSAVLIAAEYTKDGVMSDAKVDYKEILQGTKADLSVNFDSSDENKCYQFLTLRSLTNPVPLKETAKYSKGCDKYSRDSDNADGVVVNGRNVTVKGKSNAAIVGLSVIKPDTESIDYSDVMSSLAYVDTSVPDSSGEYSFSFNLPNGAEEGLYTAYIASAAEDCRTVTFIYAKTAEKVLSYLNDAETADDLMKITEPNANLLELDKSNLYKLFYLTSDDDTKEAIAGKVLDKVKGKNPDKESLKKAFDDEVILNTVNGITTYRPIYDLLTKCPDDLGLNEKTTGRNGNSVSYKEMLNSLSDKTSPAKEIYGNSYNDADEFISDIKRAILNKYNSSSSGNGGSGGSGGGGGGSSNKEKFTIVSPAIVDPVPTSTPSAAPDTNSGSSDKFSDLNGYDWAKNHINKLNLKGIINGIGDSKFAPGENVTREQFVKMLVLSLGLYDGSAKCSFTDVNEGEWHYDYIASAVNMGIVNGMGDGSFGVGMNITRQEMAAMAYRASVVAGIDFTDSKLDFNDADEIADWAKEAVSNMAGLGIITGMGNGNFEAKGFANRAQAAVIIGRLLDKIS